MNEGAHIQEALKADEGLYHELLTLVTAEGQRLRMPGSFSSFEYYQARKRILSRLDESLEKLRRIRVVWAGLNLEQRSRTPELPGLIRKNQDLVMKILVMDRENEQGLLRRGLLPPRGIPPLQRQRPDFVSDLYRRNSGSAP